MIQVTCFSKSYDMHEQIFLSFQLWRCSQKTPQSSLLLSLEWQLVKFGRGEMALEFDSYPRILKLLLVITYLFFVGTFMLFDTISLPN
jgi:hypothetical protein